MAPDCPYTPFNSRRLGRACGCPWDSNSYPFSNLHHIICRCPPGHGDIYSSLLGSGMLGRLLEQVHTQLRGGVGEGCRMLG